MTVTLYRSGSVHAPGSPRATALLADSTTGEIVWVGTDEAAVGLGDPDEVIDLDRRLMVPAFVDAWATSSDASPLRSAAVSGIGALHVLDAADAAARPAAGAMPGALVAQAVRYQSVEAEQLDVDLLTDRYEERTAAGEQAVIVARDDAAARRSVSAAAAVAERVGLPRFVAARHRLHLAAGLPGDVLDEVARLGLVVVFGAPTYEAALTDQAELTDGAEPSHPSARASGRPFRALAAAGVAFAFGSGPGAANPWTWVRDATVGPQAISARAAFAAATRGGHRAARDDDAGLLRPGARATFAVWEFDGELVVRTPDARVAAWSTDPRAATPGLPDLEGHSSPRCCRTVVNGVSVFR